MPERVGLPLAYDHFEKETACPFLLYFDDGKSRFLADNRIYHKRDNVRLELYTDSKDWELEEKLEDRLTDQGFIWRTMGDSLDRL